MRHDIQITFRELKSSLVSHSFLELDWILDEGDNTVILNNNEDSSIMIVTDTLGVGWDSKYTRNAVLLGELDNVNEFVQKIGRIGCDRQAVSHPQAFLYYTRGAIEKARAVIDQHQEHRRVPSKAKHESGMETLQKRRGKLCMLLATLPLFTITILQPKCMV
jgi:superfamily II DNA helicase RecQ